MIENMRKQEAAFNAACEDVLRLRNQLKEGSSSA